MLFFLFINVKMPIIVGILTFMSRKIFMLNSVEHEKSFITSGPDFTNNSTFELHRIRNIESTAGCEIISR